ncbi:MAG: type VI secretion system contractile sheath small subunit [Desulfovibrio sp.]|jgi:type VI secretion system protein ImpB|nr:type VI secretion system contractile sheath small subunit [Desulfovibrio sp.]
MAKKEATIAPKERINVTFKPATGGAVEEIELPMKVMVLGDFLQRHDSRPLIDRKPVSVNKNNFEEVMAKQNLAMTLSIPNVLQDDETEDELPVNLQIGSMKDFEPASILEQIPETNKLMRVREALVSLKGPMGNMPAFRKALDDVLKDPRQRAAVQKELQQAGIDLTLTPAKKRDKGDAKKPVKDTANT